MKKFLRLCRYKQWIKNLFVLAPLFFSFRFLEIESWPAALIAMLSFILLSSTIYILNDIRDREEDRQHPRKKLRPIASGAISVKTATFTAGLLISGVLCIALTMLPLACNIVLLVYGVMQLLYSYKLKEQPVIDVLIIATGFVLRILMGGFAIDVDVSPWIVLTTFLLALFLGFGKRYHELLFHKATRKSLQGYNRPLLDRFISISCGATLVCYALYAVETAREIAKTEFVFTVVFVLYGLFRYLNAIYMRKDSGEPEEIIIRDMPFVVNGFLWAVTTLVILIY